MDHTTMINWPAYYKRVEALYQRLQGNPDTELTYDSDATTDDTMAFSTVINVPDMGRVTVFAYRGRERDFGLRFAKTGMVIRLRQHSGQVTCVTSDAIAQVYMDQFLQAQGV